MAVRHSLSEKEIENQILQWANYQQHVWARKVHTIGVYDPVNKNFRKLSGYAEKGVSDLAIRIHKPTWKWGKAGVIEVKTYKAAMQFMGKFGFPCNPDQKAYIDKEIRYGCFGGVVWTLQMAMELIEPQL